MSYPVVRIDPTTPGRERSPAMWRNLLDRYGSDPLVGTLRSNDFHKPRAQTVDTTNDGWYLSEDGTGVATAEGFDTIAGGDGVVQLDAAASANFIGVKAQAGSAAAVGENIVLPTHGTDNKGIVCFEARVRLDATANDTFFIGLAEAETVLAPVTNALTTAADYIGFYRLNNGDLQFRVRNDNAGGVAVVSDWTILATASVPNATYAKLGFRVNHDNTVEVFVDGVRVTRDTGGATISVPTTALPIEYLTRTLSVARGAAAGNAVVSIDCDRIECYVSE